MNIHGPERMKPNDLPFSVTIQVKGATVATLTILTQWSATILY